MRVLLPAAVLVPLAGAALSLLLGRHRNAVRVLGAVASTATLAVAVTVLVGVDRDGTARVDAGGWPAGTGVELVADRFSALMLVVGSAMLLAVLLYAAGQRTSDERSPWYTPVYLVLTAGVSLAFLAGDLFNLFVAVEVLLIASYVLIMLEGNDAQIRSGTTYAVLNVIESTLLLTAVALVFAATGTLNLAALPERLAALPDGVALGLNLLLLIAFGLKAAVFPLFSWLPDSYPAAPSPVTAVFAGLLTKIGVYWIVRTEIQLFPGGQRTLLLAVAGLTMIVGVLGAIAQSDMKRILSFHIVSQIGYMVLGVALGGPAAVAAVIFFVLHQIPVKTSLFLVEGIVERETGTSSLEQVGGLAHRSGPLALLFLVPALSLAGIPPLSGFVGKLGIVDAGVAQGQWPMVAVALVGSLLTLVSMLKIWTGVFWGEPRPSSPRPGVLRHHPLSSAVTAAVVGVGLVVALAAGPIYRFAERAADDLTSATVAPAPERGSERGAP
jgi:multicomponent Na+:H+ antiporter subunit D